MLYELAKLEVEREERWRHRARGVRKSRISEHVLAFERPHGHGIRLTLRCRVQRAIGVVLIPFGSLQKGILDIVHER